MDTAVADCMRAADGRALTGAAILAFCVIDYIAAFPRLRVDQGTRIAEHYRATVNDYLTTINSKYRDEDIWQLRNSMLHVYGPSSNLGKANLGGFVFSHNTDNYHLDRDANNRLQIDVRELVSDSAIASWNFFDVVDRDPAMWATVEINAKSMFIVEESTNTINSRPYAGMHPALATFDGTTPDFESLRRAVREVFKDKDKVLAAYTFTIPASGVTT